MNAKTRIFVGVLSMAMLGVVGALLLAEGQTILGAVLIVLAVLRGVVAIQQIRAQQARDGS